MFIWGVIVGVFIGGIGTLVFMSAMKSGSDYDDKWLGDSQYNEN